ncbi:MAG: thiol-disulfide oxidoreductase DCC family protein [Bdellovibrionales bacterium]
MSTTKKKTIFIDGNCVLCNRSVHFFYRIKNKKEEIYFSSLQSEFAKSTLFRDFTESLNSLVFIDDENVYVKSQAVMRLLKYTKLKALRYLLNIFPRRFLDFLYDQVAKNRKKIWKNQNCRIDSKLQQWYISN